VNKKRVILNAIIYTIVAVILITLAPLCIEVMGIIGTNLLYISLREELVRLLTSLAILIAISSVLFSASRAIDDEKEKVFLITQGKSLLACVLL